MAEAAALLNVARPRMYRFVAEGRLERGEDGMLDRAAVLSMPRSTRGRRLKVG
ncbi:MAG: hypothetical protein FJ100_16175 [Deltaproteobacteria bacterium]|nr:hypothetical protein [Deltaproteobacteria bacterium]